MNFVRFGARLPRGGPVLRDLRIDACADGAQDVLCGVLVVLVMRRSVAFEIFEHGVRIGPDVSEVHSFSAASQKKKAVEVFEQDGGGLVDGAHEGHARVQFANELHDVVRGLSIKTRCRFCNTNQQKRFEERKRDNERRGGRIYHQGKESQTCPQANSKTLPLLHRDTQTSLHVTNQGITEMCHLHHLQHLLDVFVLLRQRDGGIFRMRAQRNEVPRAR